MSLPPSESEITNDGGGDVSELSGDLDRAADDYMRRAARLDPVRFARIAARYPTVPLRSLQRPRHIRLGSESIEIRDVSIDEEDAGVSNGDQQQYREWLQGQGFVP